MRPGLHLVKSLFTALLGATLVVFLATSAGAETRLLMFETDDCPWCAQWHREVGVIYEKTTEGKQAPLVRLNIYDPVPTKYDLKTRAQYTPTFVLIRDGHEVGRIEGYPGEEFFWGLLERLLTRIGPEKAQS
jgi:thioredoxin-related protein